MHAIPRNKTMKSQGNDREEDFTRSISCSVSPARLNRPPEKRSNQWKKLVIT